MNNRAALILPALAVLIGIGCVEAQPPIVRVDRNVTRKADLLNAEFYFLQTVVDTPYTSDFTFVGEQGELERIVWEIQRDFLVARRSYEYVDGSEEAGINGTEDQQGAVVAMYAIEKHFDIRHDFNPVTGEELNVIVENEDRPWDEREHMRVDWSRNLVTDPFLLLSRAFGGARMEPVSWHVDETVDSANAARFERLDPTDETSGLGYMEITNKTFVEPTAINLWGLELPMCFIYQALDGDPVDCTSAEITVRNSFLRIDPEHDYQPVLYTGDRMERFGYFITESPGYDRAYGLVEPNRYRFANRHNIWQESHRRNGDNTLMTCTADAQCDDGRGSVCDLDLGRSQRALTADNLIQGACTIPFRDRAVRPIVYHLTENYPANLMPEAQLTASEYSAAFVEVVGSMRETECTQTGGTDCAAERTRADAETMFYVCPSPVEAGAPAACGAPGTIARIGDLRFNLIGYVSEPHRSSPLGYGPSAADPRTGEIIMANAFLYGAGVDTYSAMGRDIVRLINGDLTETQIADGVPVQDWFDRMSAQSIEGAEDGHAHGNVVDIDGSDAARANQAMDFSWVRGSASRHNQGPSNPREAIALVESTLQDMHTRGAFGNGIEQGPALLERLRGTELERMMVGPEARMMAGIDPDSPVDDAVMEQASPLRGGGISRRVALQRARNQLQEMAGLDWGEFVDEGLLGLARQISRAISTGGTIDWYGTTYQLTNESGQIDYDLVRDMLRHPIMSGLTLHEVGHTMGLRHNFSGSYDSLNYNPRYWELRNDGNMHPRAWDPHTDAEINGRIEEYSYSTVMDYGNNFIVTDAQGLGHYDHAALKMGYGDLVEVFSGPVPDPTELAWYATISYYGWPVPLTFDWATGGDGTPPTAYTYTEIPGLVGGVASLQQRADVPFTSIRADARLGDYPTFDQQGRVVVPYIFCSDEQADLNLECSRYDHGADQYESAQSVINSYWNYYIFTNFRRGRIGFNADGVANRIAGRYFEKLQRANQSYALYRALFQEVFDIEPDDAFWSNERGMGANTLAVSAAYQTFLRIITAPEPGGYSQAARGDGTMAMLPGGSEARVDSFDGRFLETTWDFDAGYYWFDQLERVGYFYDKVLAIQFLTDPTTYFIGRDTDADIRRYQLSFASTFGPSMTRFFGGLLAEDWRSIAPRVQSGVVVYPDPLQIEQGDMGGVPVQPNASFSIQLYATIFGMALIPQTYDQDFLNRSRIWVRGGAEQVTTTLPTVTFTDERSGLVYEAVSYPVGVGPAAVEHGVGAQLIARANLLQAANTPAADLELESFVDNLDLARLLTWHLGFGAQP